MLDLVRSRLDRSLSVEGRAVQVRPPTVREALTLLLTFEGVLEGDSEYEAVWRETLYGWLPLRAASHLNCEAMPPPREVSLALALVLEGLPRKEQDELPEGTPKAQAKHVAEKVRLSRLNERVADYAQVYGCDPATVMDEAPFGPFLSFVEEAERILALRQLQQLETESIKHIQDDSKRKRVIEELKDRAGLNRKQPLTREERIERTKKNLKKLSLFLGRAQPNGAKPPGPS